MRYGRDRQGFGSEIKAANQPASEREKEDTHIHKHTITRMEYNSDTHIFILL